MQQLHKQPARAPGPRVGTENIWVSVVTLNRVPGSRPAGGAAALEAWACGRGAAGEQQGSCEREQELRAGAGGCASWAAEPRGLSPWPRAGRGGGGGADRPGAGLAGERAQAEAWSRGEDERSPRAEGAAGEAAGGRSLGGHSGGAETGGERGGCELPK